MEDIVLHFIIIYVMKKVVLYLKFTICLIQCEISSFLFPPATSLPKGRPSRGKTPFRDGAKKGHFYSKTYFTLYLIFLFFNVVTAQSVSKEYTKLQQSLATGWNTWSYESMLSHVLLPEGLMIRLNFRQSFIGTPGDPLIVINRAYPDSSGLIQPIAHTSDGSYTDLIINNWKGNTIRVQSTAIGKEVAILITPLKKSENIRFQVEVEAAILWNGTGNGQRSGEKIVAQTEKSQLNIQGTKQTIEAYHPYASPYLVYKGDSAIGIYTGKIKTLDEIKAQIQNAENKFHNDAKKYGDLAESFEAIQSVLGWNTLYDAHHKRVLSPVSRRWNEAWQGYVLFAWDTYLASYLFALDNKELAFSNAIAVTKYPNANGNIGHYQMADGTIALMSQPPIGSTICWMIYQKYPEKWFLEEVFNELLTWNRWWIKNRMNQGYLAWGGWKGANAQVASWESGLDNSPMYENVEMKEQGESSLMNLGDVGLNSLYTADCQNLAKIARVLGKTEIELELNQRAEKFAAITNTLWSEKSGFYLNKNLVTDSFSTRLSPTLFYPMIAGIASPEQGNIMLNQHFYNKKEFYGDFMLPSCAFNDPSYDNIYWRGAIWPPLNFLAYHGIKNYNTKAAQELADKSHALFIKAWKQNHCVFENINSAKGVESPQDQLMSDHYYHWGALMGIMKFVEAGWYQSNIKP